MRISHVSRNLTRQKVWSLLSVSLFGAALGQSTPLFSTTDIDTTSIPLLLPEAESGSIGIFDVTGKLIQNVHSGPLHEGENTFSIDVRNWPQGMYFYRFSGIRHALNHKLMVRSY